jgi:phospholipid/cholesterol/gamma-HCH transport system ATP-binding protein
VNNHEPVIVVEDLWKSYNGLQVLRGISFEVHRGETLVVVGLSGAGKSVMLRHIMGLEPPDRGKIMINGTDITALDERERLDLLRSMGMLFQQSALFDSMTVAENTAFYLLQHGDPRTGEFLSGDEIMERVRHALKLAHLEDAEEKMPSDLSGGMRKRAALARLLAYRPEILLYDEPTTGLDPITAQQINELIKNVQRELEATSIVVTHDMASAFEVGDRLALHSGGKLTYIVEKEKFAQIDDPIVKQFLNYSAPVN